ncbi:ATP-binding protein [Streptomyces griseorubiginosus]|uniref:ATP-binding protein n=1 Tax=Streptomyces griseorubiginosus TaxID=67304 RepID=UPI0036EFF36E
MSERFEVAPRRGQAPAREEDACRVGMMRRIAAARLRYCGLDALIDEVMVIVSELLTNAVLHSGTTEVALGLSVRDGFLRVTVTDGMPGGAARKEVTENAESGRGLALVDALVAEHSGSWGTSDNGATTWCDLTIPSVDPSESPRRWEVS